MENKPRKLSDLDPASQEYKECKRALDEARNGVGNYEQAIKKFNWTRLVTWSTIAAITFLIFHLLLDLIAGIISKLLWP